MTAMFNLLLHSNGQLSPSNLQPLQVPPADFFQGSWSIGISNHTACLLEEDCTLVHGRPQMMKDQILMSLTVAQLKPSSFQRCEEACPVKKDRVYRGPSLVDWRITRRADHLLLDLHDAQPCKMSSSVDHLLCVLEW